MKVPLNGSDKYALVDECDAWVLEMKWHIHNRGYAACNTWDGEKTVSRLLHRVIMNPPKGMEVDHINGIRLDCRRENLRIVTRSQNHMNRASRPNKSTGIIGVRKESRCNSWNASIKIKGKAYSKNFKSFDEAMAQRKEWEREFFGEFAPTAERLKVAPPPAIYPNRKEASRG